MLARVATRDVEVSGVRIRKGQKLLTAYPSANRDPRQFPEPDRFVLGRQPNRHLGFGVGPHRCLGSNLARLQFKVGMQELLRRIPGLRLAPGARVAYRTRFSRGIAALPLVFTPAERERLDASRSVNERIDG